MGANKKTYTRFKCKKCNADPKKDNCIRCHGFGYLDISHDNWGEPYTVLKGVKTR